MKQESPVSVCMLVCLRSMVAPENEGAKATPTTATAPGEESFAEKLATRLINNLQVTVNKIHIRYEDSISNPAVLHPQLTPLQPIPMHSIEHDADASNARSEWHR